MTGAVYTQAQVDQLLADQRVNLLAQFEVLLFTSLRRGMALLDTMNPTAALAGACVTFRCDVTQLGMSGSTIGRLRADVVRLAATSIREDVMGSGTIQTIDTTALNAVRDVNVCIESDLPERMEEALTAAGVEISAVARLYFDETHGRTFRLRMAAKWKIFCSLAARGGMTNPTGYFVSAIRQNWHLSLNWTPGKKREKAASAQPECPVEVGAVVRHAGGADRFVVRSLILKAGQWYANIWHPEQDYDSDRPCRELRLA